MIQHVTRPFKEPLMIGYLFISGGYLLNGLRNMLQQNRKYNWILNSRNPELIEYNLRMNLYFLEIAPY